MAHSSVIQDVRSVMYPIFNLAQGLYSLSLDFCPVLRDKVLNLAIVIFDSLVEALGNEGRRLCDS